jgi:hypothetical protein
MPTTQLPETKEKAAEISRKITNSRPSTRDKHSPEGQVSGGFNQKSRLEADDQAKIDDTSAAEGDGQ